MLYIKEHLLVFNQETKPTLVFIHGLLGSGRDWQEVIKSLSEYRSLTVDLPGHGNSEAIAPVSFEHSCELILQAIRTQVDEQSEIVLIGYSLGARLIMFGLAHHLFSRLNVVGYCLEGGNFGLTDSTQRKLRLQSDNQWASRFEQEPIENVLAGWYQQPVFHSLIRSQRKALVISRANNHGKSVAKMLIATSLSKQPYLLEKLRISKNNIHYICGEKDAKFHELAKKSQLSFTSVSDAGHNVHHEQPEKFAQIVRDWLVL